MFDFRQVKLDIVCPRCQFWNVATLKQIELRDVVICRGCKANLQLDDYLNKARRARSDIEEALVSLRRTFKAVSLKFKT